MSSSFDPTTVPLRWPYSRNPHFPDELEPGLDVMLIGPKARAIVRGVIDSGAGTSAIPLEFAEPLGVDLSRATTKTAYSNGIEHELLCPVEPLFIVIGNHRIELQEPVFGAWGGVLLGRCDVFRHFLVVIDERAQQFVLDPYPPEDACR